MTITIILLIAICIVAITLIIQYYLERDKSSNKNMKRKEEIEKAARKYVDGVTLSSPSNVLHFEAGAKWADEHPNFGSVWHDTSEEPEGDCCDIIHQDENGCCWLESKADIMRLYDTWNEFTEVEMIIRWAYVSDLLPKGDKKND